MDKGENWALRVFGVIGFFNGMPQISPKDPYSFSRFLRESAKNGWLEAEEKLSRFLTWVAIVSPIILFASMHYSKTTTSGEEERRETVMNRLEIFIPFFVWLVWLVFHVLRAPYKIYKVQFQKHQEEIQKLNQQIETLLNEEARQTKSQNDKKSKLTFLNNSLGRLQVRLRMLNGSNRHFEVNQEHVRATQELITQIYNDLYEVLGPGIAALFTGSKSTQKDLERFGVVNSLYDQSWTQHLDFIDAHIDSLLKIIEKQL